MKWLKIIVSVIVQLLLYLQKIMYFRSGVVLMNVRKVKGVDFLIMGGI